MANPYHDEKGQFTSGGSGSSKMTFAGDKVRISPKVRGGGGTARLTGFSPSGDYGITDRPSAPYVHMSDLRVIERGESGRSYDIQQKLRISGR